MRFTILEEHYIDKFAREASPLQGLRRGCSDCAMGTHFSWRFGSEGEKEEHLQLRFGGEAKGFLTGELSNIKGIFTVIF